MTMGGEPAKLLGIGGGLKFNVIYDKLRLTAYIYSDRLEIPAKSASLTTKIAEGVSAVQGGKGSASALERSVHVPGLYSLGVTGASLTLVDNEQLEPEQVMLVTISADVFEKEMGAGVSAWLLPLYHPDQKPEERKSPYRWYDPAKVPDKLLEMLVDYRTMQVKALVGSADFFDTGSFVIRVVDDQGRAESRDLKIGAVR